MDGLIQTKPSSFLSNSLSAYIAFSSGFLLRLLLYRAVFLELGTELFGAWAILKSILILPAFLQQALHTAIFVRSARDAKNVHRIGEFLLLTLAVSVPVGIIIFIFAPGLASFLHLAKYHQMAINGFRLCAVIFVLDSLSQLFLRLLQGLDKYKDSAILTTVTQFLNSALAILLVYSGYKILALLLLDVATTGLLVLMSAARVRFLIRPERFSFSYTKQRLQELFREASGQFLIVLSGRVLWELDPWLVPRFFGIPAMTSYYVGRRIPYTVSDILWAGAEPVVPAAANAEEEKNQTLDRIHLLQVSLAFPIGFFLWIFAGDILNVWLGIISPNAVFIMKMLVLARTIDFLPTTFLYFYFAEGKAGRILWITFAAMVTKIVGSVLAILFGGLESLILATVAGAIVYAVVLFVDARRETGKTVRQMFLPFLPGVTASVIAWLLLMLIPIESFIPRAIFFCIVAAILTTYQIRYYPKFG